MSEIIEEGWHWNGHVSHPVTHKGRKEDCPAPECGPDPSSPLNALAREIHKSVIEKGFYDEERSFAEEVALMHSELSEALEEWRDGWKPSAVYYDAEGDLAKPEGVPVELADVIIRILDSCANYGIDIDEAIRLKMAFNKTRPHKHGRAH